MNNLQTGSCDLMRRKDQLPAVPIKDENGREYGKTAVRQADTFITENEQPDEMEYIYVLLSEELKQNYADYGLLPYKPESHGHDQYLFLPADMKRTCVRSHPSGVVVDNIAHKLLVWWKAQPDHIRRAFSPLPTAEQSWKKFGLGTKISIYNYSILKENALPLSFDSEREIVTEIVGELTDIALEMLNGKSVEEMCDPEGLFLEKYRDQFNRIYDDIGAGLLETCFNNP